MGLLENKRIIVTGGSMGIGLAVAKLCAQEGAQLILVSRNEGDLKNAASSLKARAAHTYYVLDVSNPVKIKEMAHFIEKKYGYIDGLVNCAGVYGPIGKLDEIDAQEFVKALNINLIGTFYMCYYFIPLLKKAARGKIVNYSGGGAASPFPNYSAYAVSKSAIVRFTENIALEFINDRLDINTIAPGFVITRLHQETLKAGTKAGENFLKMTKEQIGKGGVPPEVPAKLSVFLLSQESDGITGKFISAPWDPWQDSAFLEKLRKDKDFAVLRRIDNKTFFKKEQG